MCLGSLAVKRVLGKDESAGSNPASGFPASHGFSRYFTTLYEEK